MRLQFEGRVNPSAIRRRLVRRKAGIVATLPEVVGLGSDLITL